MPQTADSSSDIDCQGMQFSKRDSGMLPAWGSTENSSAPEDLQTLLPSTSHSGQGATSGLRSSLDISPLYRAPSAVADQGHLDSAQGVLKVQELPQQLPRLPDLQPQEVLVQVQVQQRTQKQDQWGTLPRNQQHQRAGQQQQWQPDQQLHEIQQQEQQSQPQLPKPDFPAQDHLQVHPQYLDQHEQDQHQHQAGNQHSRQSSHQQQHTGEVYNTISSRSSSRASRSGSSGYSRHHAAVPSLDLGRVKTGSSAAVKNIAEELTLPQDKADKETELCFEQCSSVSIRVNPHAPVQDNRCYQYRAIGPKELSAVQALLSRLPGSEVSEVQDIWDALLVARRDCEAMAARGLRISRDISRDWQETVSDLIDRVVSQDNELAQLRQQLKAAASSPGAGGAPAGSSVEELHGQVVRLKRHRDRLMRDQQDLSRALTDTQMALHGAQQEAVAAQDQLACLQQQSQQLREQHASLLQQHIELAAYAESLEATTAALQAQQHAFMCRPRCALPLASLPAAAAAGGRDGGSSEMQGPASGRVSPFSSFAHDEQAAGPPPLATSSNRGSSGRTTGSSGGQQRTQLQQQQLHMEFLHQHPPQPHGWGGAEGQSNGPHSRDGAVASDYVLVAAAAAAATAAAGSSVVSNASNPAAFRCTSPSSRWYQPGFASLAALPKALGLGRSSKRSHAHASRAYSSTVQGTMPVPVAASNATARAAESLVSQAAAAAAPPGFPAAFSNPLAGDAAAAGSRSGSDSGSESHFVSAPAASEVTAAAGHPFQTDDADDNSVTSSCAHGAIQQQAATVTAAAAPAASEARFTRENKKSSTSSSAPGSIHTQAALASRLLHGNLTNSCPGVNPAVRAASAATAPDMARMYSSDTPGPRAGRGLDTIPAQYHVLHRSSSRMGLLHNAAGQYVLLETESSRQFDQSAADHPLLAVGPGMVHPQLMQQWPPGAVGYVVAGVAPQSGCKTEQLMQSGGGGAGSMHGGVLAGPARHSKVQQAPGLAAQQQAKLCTNMRGVVQQAAPQLQAESSAPSV